MTGIIIAIIVIAVVAIVGFAAWRYIQHRRSEQLKDRFGPEYDRAKDQYGSKAESVLSDRQKTVDEAGVKPLSAGDRRRYLDEWQSIQARFVDDPNGSVIRADHVVTDVMRSMNYPAGVFKEREDAVSVQYPDVADNYRRAHAIAHQAQDGEASTDDLREATLLLRSLFEKLVENVESRTESAVT